VAEGDRCLMENCYVFVFQDLRNLAPFLSAVANPHSRMFFLDITVIVAVKVDADVDTFVDITG
jgi:hypothetical protein